MTKTYLHGYGTRSTPQSEPIRGHNMVQDESGGYVYGIGKWDRLQRFLIIGSEGGSYYASERKLTNENIDSLYECLAEDGLRTVSLIVDISESGRAPKNDQAIFALAVAASYDDDKTRRAALDAIPRVCRIGTHIFQFASYVEQFRGWGRGLRNAVAAWYLDKDAENLAYQLVKYQQREGWSHRDLLRLCHAKADTPEINRVLRWATHGLEKPNPFLDAEARLDGVLVAMPPAIKGYHKAQNAKSPEQVAQAIRDYRIPREAIPTEMLNDVSVWRALLEEMPLIALVRNLATMTRNGVLQPGNDALEVACQRMADPELIRKSKIHPVNVLMGMKTYGSGESLRGSNTWTPLPKVMDAFDQLFYDAFGNVQPSGKSRLIALDVSGSMSGKQGDYWGSFPDVPGFPGLAPREVASAMAMVSMKTGDPYEIVAFTSDRNRYSGYDHYENVPQIIDGLSVLNFSARQRLDDICKATEKMFPGGTDCSLPFLYATQAGRSFDIFEVYTDSDTNANRNIHPAQALKQYREQSGINAKSVVVGMVSNGFTIADPNDPGMLDVVGFDTATPNLISAFAEGGF